MKNRSFFTQLSALAFLGAVSFVATTANAMTNGATCVSPCSKSLGTSFVSTDPAMAKRDYLITVGKHAVWASSVPKRVAQASSASVAASQDYPVTVGKRTMMASQVAPQQRMTAAVANPCLSSGYVTTGKTTRFAPACSLRGDTAAPSCCQ